MNHMMEKLKNLKLWQQLLLVFLIVGIVVLVSVFAMKPDTYEVLYSNLDPNEAIQIEQEIAKMGVKTKLEDEGTMISIDGANIPRVKAHLASMGLPSSGDPGFELLSETSIGATKFDKEKQYEQALIGDIQRGLVQGFDFVNKAIVQLNYTESASIFEEASESKAAVTIHTKNNQPLNETQVKSIRNFVASSVKNLKPESVDVADKDGIVYGMEEESLTTASGYAKQIQIVEQTEKRIRDDIMRMLSKNFGADNVTLVVRADINFDEIVRNIEKYDPQGTMVSRQEKNESIEKKEGEPVVTPGTDTNGTVPDYELDEETSVTQLTQESNEIIENFEVGKTVETIKENPELTDIRVTATINEAIDPANLPNFVAEWEELIATSAGIVINEDGTFANGYVKVSPQVYSTNLVGDETPSDVVVDTQEDQRLITMVFLYGGLGLALLAMLAWFMHKRREEIVVTQHGVPFDGELQSRYEDTLKVEEINKGEKEEKDDSIARSDVLMQQINKHKKTKRIDLDELNDEQREIAAKVREIAEEDPNRTAEYIKKLINEG